MRSASPTLLFLFRKLHFCLSPYIFCLCSKTILFVTKQKRPLSLISTCFEGVFILIAVMCKPGITSTRLVTSSKNVAGGGRAQLGCPPPAHIYLYLSPSKLFRRVCNFTLPSENLRPPILSTFSTIQVIDFPASLDLQISKYIG